MRKLISALILAACVIPVMAQQQIVIPAVPDQPFVVAGHPAQTYTVDTCTYVPSTGVLTINGVAVNALALTSISLTGGINYQPGIYNASIAADGGLTYVPVGSGPSGSIYTVTLTKINGTSWAIVTGLTLASGQQATAMAVPTHSGPPVPADWYYYSNSQPRVQVDTTGAVYVGVSNSTAAQIATVSVTVTVK